MINKDTYKKKYELECEAHKKTKIKLAARERDLRTITLSNSYKLAKTLALSRRGVGLLVDRVKYLNPRRMKLISSNKMRVKTIYDSQQFKRATTQPSTSDLAVIIHLYYVEMFPFFVEKLINLQHINYDLFITIPEDKIEIRETIIKQYPEARIAVVPNCGRDVLPFIEVTRQIAKLGYSKVLKLHSKKSPHRQDGSLWRDRIINSLLPANETLINKIIEILNNKTTAIVGPTGEYVSLLVNFSATHHHMKRFPKKVLNSELSKKIIDLSDEYGFFAGTMFWARIDALMPIIDNISPVDFEPEFGQVDSTLAHALERLFSVIPELQGKDMYELTKNEVKYINYHTTNIPAWSEVALKD